MCKQTLDIAESMVEGDDVEQFVRPEIRLVITDQRRNLFGDKNDTDSSQHSFDHCRWNKLSETTSFYKTQYHL